MALELQLHSHGLLFLVLSLFRMRSLVMVIPERCKALARGDVSWISWGWRNKLLIRCMCHSSSQV